MKKIFLLMLLSYYFPAFIYIHAKVGTVYAVIVGVSQYSDPWLNLNYCHKDAEIFYNLLSQHTEKQNLVKLTNQTANKRNIILSAQRLYAKAKPEDVIIFFFSGHGTKGSFLAHDKDLMYQDLQAVFKTSKAKRKLIFADACFSGDLRSQESVNSQSSEILGKNVLLFLSSRSNQISLEASSLEYGAFTHYLQLGLKGGADINRDKKITAKELFDFVNPRVKAYTDGRQIPVMWGKFNDNMIIFNWNK